MEKARKGFLCSILSGIGRFGLSADDGRAGLDLKFLWGMAKSKSAKYVANFHSINIPRV